jgi:hypothetical protein
MPGARDAVKNTTNQAVVKAISLPDNISNTGSFKEDLVDRSEATKKNVYGFNSDREYGVFENQSDAVTRLPSSLFYEAQSSEDGRLGLFNYHVIGDLKASEGGGGKMSYIKSETYANNQRVTPEVSRNPTAQAIIGTTTSSGAYLKPNSPYVSQPYNVKDFIFCKYYGVIPNNRMITLRRFPTPVMDNLRVPTTAPRIEASQEGDTIKGNLVPRDGLNTAQMIKDGTALPIAQAVTYFGGDTGNTLDSILNVETGLKWEPKGQKTKLGAEGNDKGFLGSTYGKYIESIIGAEAFNTTQNISNGIGVVTDPDNRELQIRRQLLEKLTTGDGPLSQRIFVDVNTVNSMYVRGVGFTGGEQTFSLKFTYSLTSVGEVNSRMMFIDLFANLLAIGSDYGKFLAPQLLVNSNRQGIGFPGGSKGYVKHLTNPVEFLNDMMKMKFGEEVKKKIKGLEGQLSKAQTELTGLSNGKPLSKNGQLYKTLTVMLTSDLLNNLYYEPIMLSGYPTGEWHVVVGNPLNPIAMMGNLICEKVKINFNNTLGPDDFPTEMTAVFSMRAARTKHRGDFESMFNRGNGRLYLGKFPISDASKNAQVGASTGIDIQGNLQSNNARNVAFGFAGNYGQELGL